MRRAIPTLFVLLMVGAIFPPFVRLAGPLSLDDLLPLAAVLLGLAVIPFSQKRLEFDATIVGFALLALAGLISNAANADSFTDFLRFTGRSTGRIVYYYALLLGTRAILDRDGWSRRALAFVVGAASVESIFCIFAFVTEYSGPYGLGVIAFPDWSVLFGKIRVQGTFSGEQLRYEVTAVSANFLAAYLLLCIPVTVGLIGWVRSLACRAVLACAAILQIATLYLTYTRASLVAFGLAILAMGFLAGRRRLAAAVLIAAVVAAMSIPTVRTKIIGEGHDRWSLYWSSIRITADNAVFGVGDGRYESVLNENQRYSETPFGIATTTSHNSVLLSAANYGILGGAAHALLYLLLLATVFREMRRVQDRRLKVLLAGMVAGIIGYLAQDQLNNLAYVPKVATQMWFIYALVPLVARSLKTDAVEETRVLRLYPIALEKGVDHSHP